MPLRFWFTDIKFAHNRNEISFWISLLNGLITTKVWFALTSNQFVVPIPLLKTKKKWNITE